MVHSPRGKRAGNKRKISCRKISAMDRSKALITRKTSDVEEERHELERVNNFLKEMFGSDLDDSTTD